MTCQMKPRHRTFILVCAFGMAFNGASVTQKYTDDCARHLPPILDKLRCVPH